MYIEADPEQKNPDKITIVLVKNWFEKLLGKKDETKEFEFINDDWFFFIDNDNWCSFASLKEQQVLDAIRKCIVAKASR